MQALAEASQDEVNELWAGASKLRILLDCPAGYIEIASALPFEFGFWERPELLHGPMPGQNCL